MEHVHNEYAPLEHVHTMEDITDFPEIVDEYVPEDIKDGQITVGPDSEFIVRGYNQTNTWYSIGIPPIFMWDGTVYEQKLTMDGVDSVISDDNTEHFNGLIRASPFTNSFLLCLVLDNITETMTKTVHVYINTSKMVIDEDITITCSYTPHTDMTAKTLLTANVVNEHVNYVAAPKEHVHNLQDITDFDADKFIQYNVNVMTNNPTRPNFKDQYVSENSGASLADFYVSYSNVIITKKTSIEELMSPFSISYKGQNKAVILTDSGLVEGTGEDSPDIEVVSLDPPKFQVDVSQTYFKDEITISFLGEIQTITVTKNNAYDLRRQVPTVEVLMDLIHPIGSIYTSFLPTNPSTLFGGKWEQIVDKFLYCASTSVEVGGSKKISVANLPAHNHTVAIIKTIEEASNYGLRWGETGFFERVMVSSNSSAKQTSTSNTGNGTDYMPPYMTVYAWKRTA